MSSRIAQGTHYLQLLSALRDWHLNIAIHRVVIKSHQRSSAYFLTQGVVRADARLLQSNASIRASNKA